MRVAVNRRPAAAAAAKRLRCPLFSLGVETSVFTALARQQASSEITSTPVVQLVYLAGVFNFLNEPSATTLRQIR